MRRSDHVPFAAVAGAAPGAVAAPASAGPAARITPRTVAQGGLDTVSVSCDAVGGALPEFIDAASYAFDEGRGRLDRVGGHDYADGGGMQARSPGAVVYSGTARIPVGGKFRSRIPGQRQTQSRTPDQAQVPGQYRGQARGQGQEGSDDRGQGQSPPGVQHGSQAGMGGAFCGSVPSLVAGGPLSAAVLGAAAHRLRRHGPSVDR